MKHSTATLWEVRTKLAVVHELLCGKLVDTEFLTTAAVCLKQIREYAIQLEEQ